MQNIPSIALALGIGSSPRAGHEHKWNRRTASAGSTDILQSTLAPCKRHTNTFQEDILLPSLSVKVSHISFPNLTPSCSSFCELQATGIRQKKTQEHPDKGFLRSAENYTN